MDLIDQVGYKDSVATDGWKVRGMAAPGLLAKTLED
jgi:hypothetical protein